MCVFLECHPEPEQMQCYITICLRGRPAANILLAPGAQAGPNTICALSDITFKNILNGCMYAIFSAWCVTCRYAHHH